MASEMRFGEHRQTGEAALSTKLVPRRSADWFQVKIMNNIGKYTLKHLRITEPLRVAPKRVHEPFNSRGKVADVVWG